MTRAGRGFDWLTAETGKPFIRVKDIIADDNFLALGIPHFQRGLVWGEDSEAALLESLFHETPCGSFVFWKSTDNSNYGEPIQQPHGRGSSEIDYLVVDGQQRIKSIHKIFRELKRSIKGGGTVERSDGDIWYVNLTKLPGVQEFFERPRKESPLFLRMPAPPKDRHVLKRKAVPLHLLLDFSDDASVKLRLYLSRKCNDGKRWIRLISEDSFEAFLGEITKRREDFERILAQDFYVRVLESDDLAEIVGVYNRINSGGKRVESEEKAFASLVTLHPPTYDHITRIFTQVHSPTDGMTAGLGGTKVVLKSDREDVLKREKERNFGFKLFIRVFLQVCAYHFGYTPGGSSFSFDLVRKANFQETMRKRDSDAKDRLWTIAREAIVFVHSVIRKELKCDNLGFLPEANSLMPAFQLLIEYPEFMRDAKYRPLVAYLVLFEYLKDDPKAIIKDVETIYNPRSVVFRSLARVLGAESKQVLEKLKTRLRKSRSIRDRFVLMLYWLCRKREAKDFSYDNIKADKKPYDGIEKPVCTKYEPEKQHIVPFSRMDDFFNDDDANRTGSHDFNSIGNFTYISHESNTLGGLENNFIDLAKDEPENLKRHFLWTEDGGVAKLYNEIQLCLDPASGEMQQSLSKDKVMEKYKDFCARRCELIANGFAEWLEELEKMVCENLDLGKISDIKQLEAGRDRLEPVPPLFEGWREWRRSHQIRWFGYENEVEDKLIGLIDWLEKEKIGKRVSLPRTKNPEECIRIKFMKNMIVYLDLKKAGISLNFNRHTKESVRRMFLEEFGLFGYEQSADIDSIVLYAKDRVDKARVLRADIEGLLLRFKDATREFLTIPRTDRRWTRKKMLEHCAKRGTENNVERLLALIESHKGVKWNWGRGAKEPSVHVRSGKRKLLSIYCQESPIVNIPISLLQKTMGRDRRGVAEHCQRLIGPGARIKSEKSDDVSVAVSDLMSFDDSLSGFKSILDACLKKHAN